ncbi:precorrin-6A synthase (deacetylating) [Hansschlegelia quercus]|uniref:Precorrin-6A synthase [deacetylating] n=1 Tax=Hansschlegelia quercus TaxID=2528245 RepID=A0A4Q9GPB5_9HYPH|nr:precorrin-6A synthase (deacetylating) [Hansschlegelia quercus]TBN53417.1 precorrin-6A synthase (deacetylating) [Hansschlegelia quercus]
MGKTILLIGIGAGDPEQITIQAINALNRTDAFFLMDKGASKEKLNALRKDILDLYATERPHRFIDGTMPEREREGVAYDAAVADLNARKLAVFDRMIGEELGDGETGAFLIWGDPALYDSTIRIMEEIEATGRHDLSWEVIPGISSVQALAAKHRVTLNTIGGAFTVTTGRRLVQGWPAGVDTAIVMLDADNAYASLPAADSIDIYWGAYVGSNDEILISGRLDQVADEIVERRAAARSANGWIMDSYLLRKRGP